LCSIGLRLWHSARAGQSSLRRESDFDQQYLVADLRTNQTNTTLAIQVRF